MKTLLGLLFPLVVYAGLTACSDASVERDKLHEDLPREALQKAISVYDVKAMPTGVYLKGEFQPDKILITAKARNNTSYTFKDRTLIQLTIKTSGEISKKVGRNELMALLTPVELIKDWQPNEEIALQDEVDSEQAKTKEESAIESMLMQELVKEQKLSINQFAPLVGKMDFTVLLAHAKDCFRSDCLYKKLPRTNKNFCGSEVDLAGGGVSAAVALDEVVPACLKEYSQKGNSKGLDELLEEYLRTLELVSKKEDVFLLSHVKNLKGDFIEMEEWVCDAQKKYGRPKIIKSVSGAKVKNKH